MAVLIETRLNSLKLNESASPRKGCLGRLEGICADFKNPTRNGRFYSRKLWENVFNDSIFQESLKSKTLLGELDHPEDRLEVLAGEACIVMTDYSIDDDEGVVRAGFDILDTPRGKILKSLLDYGCVMGVSSRGQGDITTTSEGETVDENTYDFACFDVVTTPAVAKARQNVVESAKKTRTFVESIKTQIKEAETVGDLNAIKKVISITQTPEMDSLIESIDDKCKSIQDGKTITSAVRNDLPEASIKTDKSIVESIDDTNNVTAKTIREHKELVSCLNKLRKQNNAYKFRESELLKLIEAKETELNTLRESVKSFKTRNRDNKILANKLNSQNRNLAEKLQQTTTQMTTDANDRISRLETIIRSKDSKISDLKESYDYQHKSNATLKSQLSVKSEELNKVKNNLIISSKEVKRLQESLSDKEQCIAAMQEELDKYANKEDTYENEISSLRHMNEHLQQKFEALETNAIAEQRESTINANEMESEINSYTQIIDNLQEQVNTLKSQKDEANTVNKKLLDRCKQLSESVSQYQKTYVNTKSKQLGVDPSLISRYVTNDTSISQINKLVEDVQKTKDRYAKLPISENAPIGVTIDSSYIKPKDDEMERLTSFVEKVANGGHC